MFTCLLKFFKAGQCCNLSMQCSNVLKQIHGGTSYKEIEKKVAEAEKLALRNQSINVDTVLFFDEANTTDAIDLIKEIMVDRRVKGRYIDPKLTSLHFIAACNPYRKLVFNFNFVMLF